MSRLTKFGTMLALAVTMVGAQARFATAATINVLWYAGGVEESTDFDYKADIGELAASAPGAPGGNTWNVTFWDSGAQPSGTYDVLVVTSPEGGWASNPDYSALTAASVGSEIGDRVMVTGQDADWHYVNFPGPASFDGPQGFLLDAINWAGSGTGMGAVFLGDTSLGRSILGGSSAGFDYSDGSGNDIVIPSAFATNPINTNLTSAGLSNWSTSAHDTYSITDSSKWVAINTLGVDGAPITIISAATAGGDITPTPEPGSLTLLGLGLMGVAAKVRRRFGDA